MSAETFYATDRSLTFNDFAGVALRLIQAQGLNETSLFSGTRLFQEDLEPETKLSALSLNRLLNNAIKLWGGPGFAFELGSLAAERTKSHPLVTALEHQTRAGKFYTLHGAFGADLQPSWLESLAVICSQTTNDSGNCSFYFPFPEPAHIEHYEVFIRGQCTFDYPIAGLRIEKENAQGKFMSSQRAFIEDVRSCLHKNCRAQQAEIAEAFDLSLSSFKRHLRAHGCCFQALLDETLRSKALVRLLLEGYPIDAVSVDLGYSDQRSFRRSFVRWTGMTPSAFLQAHLKHSWA